MSRRSYKTLILDDEPLARQRLVRLLERDPELELLEVCHDLQQARQCLRGSTPDILLLDIQVPDGSGFDLFADLQPLPAVVFVTAHDRYALRAFDVEADDYVLKPYDDARLLEAVARAKRCVEQREMASVGHEVIDALGGQVARPAGMRRIVAQHDGRAVLLDPQQIDWIEAHGKQCRLHCADSVHIARCSLAELEQSLEPQGFARISRSTVVNLHRVREAYPMFSGNWELRLVDGTELPVSRRYKPNLDAHLGVRLSVSD